MIDTDIKYSTGEIEWYNNTLSMCEPWDMQNKDYIQMCDTYHLQEEDGFFGKERLDCYNIDKILDAKYEKLDMCVC